MRIASSKNKYHQVANKTELNLIFIKFTVLAKKKAKFAKNKSVEDYLRMFAGPSASDLQMFPRLTAMRFHG